jgi:hypothetical protein
MTAHPLYTAWSSMHERCYNVNSKRYPPYGGRGITVCDRWFKFEDFAADMGERPPGTSLDRIDNEGNYEPSNCRWATVKEQTRNTRRTRWIDTLWGRLPLVEAAERAGIRYDTLRGRLQLGWPVSKALKQPVVAPYLRTTTDDRSASPKHEPAPQ